MVRPHRIAQKSIGHPPTGQLAPRDVPPLPEQQPDSPQYVLQGEDSFEIVVTVPAGEDTQEAQQLSQNDDHDNNHEEEEREEGNTAEGEDDEDYTLLSDAEKDETFRDADEIKTAGNEAPIPTDRLRDLLNHLNITTHPEFRIKRVPRPQDLDASSWLPIYFSTA
jgi:hypothetical protein